MLAWIVVCRASINGDDVQAETALRCMFFLRASVLLPLLTRFVT